MTFRARLTPRWHWPCGDFAGGGCAGVLHDLPGVDENLQAHSEVYVQYACKQPINLNGKMGLWGRFLIRAEWVLFKRGLSISHHFVSGGLIRSEASLASPDIQFHFLPAAMRYDGKKPLDGHGFMVLTGPNKPKSRGLCGCARPIPTSRRIYFSTILTAKISALACA